MARTLTLNFKKWFKPIRKLADQTTKNFQMAPRRGLVLHSAPLGGGPGAYIVAIDNGQTSSGSLAAHGLSTVESGRRGRVPKNPAAPAPGSASSDEPAYRENAAAPPSRTAAPRDRDVASTESASGGDEDSGPAGAAVAVVQRPDERPRALRKGEGGGGDPRDGAGLSRVPVPTPSRAGTRGAGSRGAPAWPAAASSSR